MLFRKFSLRFSLSLLIALWSPYCLFCQGAEGTISGVVQDAQTLKPLTFVNIVVMTKSDSIIVTGGVSDSVGKFAILHVHPGSYRVAFRMLGYREHRSSVILDAAHTSVMLGTIKLNQSAVSLNEQVVTGQAETFNNSIDKKVYNVAQDVMSKSGSASDALQNVPSVQVDIDGNVSLRGSSNVVMMINGKTSPLLDQNAATYLQQLPANAIEKIEVITNPSAKYKAEGTAGIINIVLKKDVDLGINGTITANGGNRDRANGNVRLNYNPGALNAYVSYSLRRDN
ncbi:MAG TPA: carboxypeptidase-like regulatory domain-containing protein, partial [Bacteroidota bacterium]|nr:carboxypeptidase-like regulatory domain-containing protein [Bacteroidota bacterium]